MLIVVFISHFYQADFDVFNALDLMENTEFLEKLKFGIGDGNLQYYLYNWKCPAMNPNKVGLVLQWFNVASSNIKLLRKKSFTRAVNSTIFTQFLSPIFNKFYNTHNMAGSLIVREKLLMYFLLLLFC